MYSNNLFPDIGQLFGETNQNLNKVQTEKDRKNNDSLSGRNFLNKKEDKSNKRPASLFQIKDSPSSLKNNLLFDLPSINLSPPSTNPSFNTSKNWRDAKNKLSKNQLFIKNLQQNDKTRHKDQVSHNLNSLPTSSQRSPVPRKFMKTEIVPESPPQPFNSTFSDQNNFLEKPQLYTPTKHFLPSYRNSNGNIREEIELHSVEELPKKFQVVFEKFSNFNAVQSKVFNTVVYSDSSVVVCAPTGSGKTAVFELAIIRLLIKRDESNNKKQKVIYMAPIKALCSERNLDWSNKFSKLGLNCQVLTGDSDVENLWQLKKADIIFTTPEKWDSMTRRWRESTSFVQSVALFLIDEVHLLNDDTRGPTMEAVVSRMKTVQKFIKDMPLRFVAVSATIPNTADVADWLSTSSTKAIRFNMDESYRPVQLRKVVLGFPCSTNNSQFKFDISLNYKLANVINTYSENKPTLIFCSTRKSVEQAASTLSQDISFSLDVSVKQFLANSTKFVKNQRLRELLSTGVGYHHAGLEANDRRIVEDLFVSGKLLVLISTSTLAMGVNLPAHLVIIKSTAHYIKGMFQEYSQSEILQMIGRAGRPQFDTSATAVVMTKFDLRETYLNMVSGSQQIESSLHNNLIEHLNAEIVLKTIHDIDMALQWIKSTFFYIRIQKNPKHYGYPEGISCDEIEKRLHDLCMQNLEDLSSIDLISISCKTNLLSTVAGRLMARYCISFSTMKTFKSLKGNESLEEMVNILSGCHEFNEITLRQNEKTTLNKLNKDKNRVTIRYPMTGRIKTSQMKVSCLLQAALGSMVIQDFNLTQDITKIFRNANRMTKCIVELLMLTKCFKSLYNGLLLSKCVQAKLWENSRFITKQFPSIGQGLSSALVNAGICSFEKLLSCHPRELELIVNRNPPFGSNLHTKAQGIPKYTVEVEQVEKYSREHCEIIVKVTLVNSQQVANSQFWDKRHMCLLLIGDADNLIIANQRISDNQLLKANDNVWSLGYQVKRAEKGDGLTVKLLSFNWVGIDIESTFTPHYVGPQRVFVSSFNSNDNYVQSKRKTSNKSRKPCRHTCYDKFHCAHSCCKVGLDEVCSYSDASTARRSIHQVPMLQQFEYKPQNKIRKPPSGKDDVSDQLDSFLEDQEALKSSFDINFVDQENYISSFEKEQSLYEDQINIGGRICDQQINQKVPSTYNEYPPDFQFVPPQSKILKKSSSDTYQQIPSFYRQVDEEMKTPKSDENSDNLWTIHGSSPTNEFFDTGCSDITEDLTTFEQFVLPNAENETENYIESNFGDESLEIPSFYQPTNVSTNNFIDENKLTKSMNEEKLQLPSTSYDPFQDDDVEIKCDFDLCDEEDQSEDLETIKAFLELNETDEEASCDRSYDVTASTSNLIDSGYLSNLTTPIKEDQQTGDFEDPNKLSELFAENKTEKVFKNRTPPKTKSSFANIFSTQFEEQPKKNFSDFFTQRDSKSSLDDENIRKKDLEEARNMLASIFN